MANENRGGGVLRGNLYISFPESNTLNISIRQPLGAKQRSDRLVPNSAVALNSIIYLHDFENPDDLITQVFFPEEFLKHKGYLIGPSISHDEVIELDLLVQFVLWFRENNQKLVQNG